MILLSREFSCPIKSENRLKISGFLYIIAVLDASRHGRFKSEAPRKGVENDVYDYFSHNHSCDNNPLDIHRYSRLSSCTADSG